MDQRSQMEADGRYRYHRSRVSAEPEREAPGHLVEGQGLIAIDKTQGDPVRKAKWTVADAIQFLAEDEKNAYLERRDHAIIAVDRTTGKPKFESKRKDFVAFATSLKNNVIYATTADGQVRAIVPVFNAGTVGEIVMQPIRDESVASAR